MNNYRKIIGWVLVAAGLILIIWTLVLSFNFFTGKTDVPQFFQVEENTEVPQIEGLEQLPDDTQILIREQLDEMLPSGFGGEMLNLAVWSMLAFILMFGGSQISGIGSKLIKDK